MATILDYKPYIGNYYKHYKGNLYLVTSIVNNSSNPSDPMVIYQGKYSSPEFGENPIWARPSSEFFGKTEDGCFRFKQCNY